MAGPLGVTHFLILSKTDNSVYLVSGHHTAPFPPSPQLLLSDDEPIALSSCDAGFKVNALKQRSRAFPSPHPPDRTLHPHPTFLWQKLMRLPGGPTLTFQINKVKKGRCESPACLGRALVTQVVFTLCLPPFSIH